MVNTSPGALSPAISRAHSQGSDPGSFGTGCVNMFFSNDPFQRYSIFQGPPSYVPKMNGLLLKYTHIEGVFQIPYEIDLMGFNGLCQKLVQRKLALGQGNPRKNTGELENRI